MCKMPDIICDIDGRLVDTSWIWYLINQNKNMSEDERFNFFNINANAQHSRLDKTCLLVLNYARKLQLAQRIVFITARSEAIATPTLNYIQLNTGLVYEKDFLLSFRPLDDKLPPAESKRVRLQKFLQEGYKFLFAIDDDPAICKMYLEHKIAAFRWLIGTIPVDLLKCLGGDICKMERGGLDLICMN